MSRHVVPICVVTYILLIPLLAEYLLKWLLKQGALQRAASVPACPSV